MGDETRRPRGAPRSGRDEVAATAWHGVQVSSEKLVTPSWGHPWIDGCDVGGTRNGTVATPTPLSPTLVALPLPRDGVVRGGTPPLRGPRLGHRSRMRGDVPARVLPGVRTVRGGRDGRASVHRGRSRVRITPRVHDVEGHQAASRNGDQGSVSVGGWRWTRGDTAVFAWRSASSADI